MTKILFFPFSARPGPPKKKVNNEKKALTRKGYDVYKIVQECPTPPPPYPPQTGVVRGGSAERRPCHTSHTSRGVQLECSSAPRSARVSPCFSVPRFPSISVRIATWSCPCVFPRDLRKFFFQRIFQVSQVFFFRPVFSSVFFRFFACGICEHRLARCHI